MRDSLSILLDGSHENGRVVHIEQGSQDGTAVVNLVEQPFGSGHLEDSLKRVNSDDKEQWGKRASFLQTTAMNDWGARHTVEKDP